MKSILTALTLLTVTFPVGAEEAGTDVPMQIKQSGAYYVPVELGGAVQSELMLDTGSEYLVVNEKTLRQLKDKAQVKYIKDVTGVMADGSEIRVPVYHLAHLNIGDRCMIENVEVAVFKGNTRQILGLSALRKVAPFSVSVEPAGLTLSNCQTISTSEHHIAKETDAENSTKESVDKKPEIASVIIPPRL